MAGARLMADRMAALVTDRTSRAGVTLVPDLPVPVPAPNEALVRIRAIGLNFGEVNTGIHVMDEGLVPGWDSAGVVEVAAADGSGPPAGSLVVTHGATGGWAEYRAVATDWLGVAPPETDPGALATIPVAAGTALRALQLTGTLGRRIMVTGATGGVGRYAVQLAHQGGAYVIAVTRSPDKHGERLRELGADDVVARPGDVDEPLDGVIDLVAGDHLVEAYVGLAPGGKLVAVGHATATETTFPVGAFHAHDGRHDRTLVTFHLHQGTPLGADLTLLARQIAARKLDAEVTWRDSWKNAEAAFAALRAGALHGKAVLDVP
ncbi:zinc-binding dehydrogenase [Streptomyces malaysiensis]|uniref:zinc-binding dehydrogenase n=1 Tax=Streptomyces malaysiensis TaxID=92644 RepID=UPI00370FDA0F